MVHPYKQKLHQKLIEEAKLAARLASLPQAAGNCASRPGMHAVASHLRLDKNIRVSATQGSE